MSAFSKEKKSIKKQGRLKAFFDDTSRAWRPFLILLIVLWLLTAVAAINIGSSSLGIKDSLRATFKPIAEGLDGLFERDYFCERFQLHTVPENHVKIVYLLRIPRIIVSSLTGLSLAAVGAVFQSIFHNPLVDPHILGLSSGAAFGATVSLLFSTEVIAIVAKILIFFGSSPTAADSAAKSFAGMQTGLFAFLGALAVVKAVHALTRNSPSESAHMLLAGSAIGIFLSSFISLMMIMNHDRLATVYMWTLGSFSTASLKDLPIILPVVLICIFVIMRSAAAINLLELSDEEAASLGINPIRLRSFLIFFAALLTATTVAFAGIISFVGLVIPHFIRLLGFYDNKKLQPLSAAAGALFLLLSDTLARTIAAPGELPVGIVTSFIGAPYFVYMLFKKRNENY